MNKHLLPFLLALLSGTPMLSVKAQSKEGVSPVEETKNTVITFKGDTLIKNNRENYSSQYNIELSSNLQQTPANQQFTNVDETVITLVHTQTKMREEGATQRAEGSARTALAKEAMSKEGVTPEQAIAQLS